jgi:hypothetical protein
MRSIGLSSCAIVQILNEAILLGLQAIVQRLQLLDLFLDASQMQDSKFLKWIHLWRAAAPKLGDRLGAVFSGQPLAQ